MADDEEIKTIPLLGVTSYESFDSPIDRRSDVYRKKAREISKVHPPPQPLLTIPNILTFFRLVLVPILYVLWFTSFKYTPAICAWVFIAASVTDWLDGYLARRLKVATVFGAFLDPVADKLMVSTALILLTISPPHPLSQQQLSIPVILMICREITMSALREWAASAGGSVHKAVKVNSLGKWKTALQMVSMSILLLLRQPSSDVFWVNFSKYIPGDVVSKDLVIVFFILLWVSAVLAVWSLAIYMSNVWTHFVNPPVPENDKKK